MKWYHRLALGLGILFALFAILNAIVTPTNLIDSNKCVLVAIFWFAIFMVIPN